MHKINLDEVTDGHKYKDLALLFDRPDFQEDLKRLKEQTREDQRKYPDLTSYLINSKGNGIARELAQKYKYPLGFTKAILFAASLGKVTDRDVENCYSAVLMHPMSVLDEYKPTLTKKDFVIFIDPHAIKRNKKIILDDIGLLLDGVLQITEPLSKNHPLNKDIKSNIRGVRDWYWERKLKGTKTKKLVEISGLEANTIDKAISDYSKVLHSEF